MNTTTNSTAAIDARRIESVMNDAFHAINEARGAIAEAYGQVREVYGNEAAMSILMETGNYLNAASGQLGLAEMALSTNA